MPSSSSSKHQKSTRRDKNVSSDTAPLDFIEQSERSGGTKPPPPSEVIKQQKNSRGGGKFTIYNADKEEVKIVQFLNIGMYSHQEDGSVPIGEPLFRPNPPVVEFHEFRALRTYINS